MILLFLPLHCNTHPSGRLPPPIPILNSPPSLKNNLVLINDIHTCACVEIQYNLNLNLLVRGWWGGGGNCSLLNIFKKREPIKFQINALCIPSALNGKKTFFQKSGIFIYMGSAPSM